MPDSLLAKALDALPNHVFLYDRDLRVRHANLAALRLSAEHELGATVLKTSGEVLSCLNARLGPSGCGSSEACKSCALRRAVGECVTTQTVVRESLRLNQDGPGGTVTRQLCVLASPFSFESQMLALVEFLDESELAELRGLLPLCPRCGASHLDDARRARVEDYFAAHPEAAADALCEACRARAQAPPA